MTIAFRHGEFGKRRSRPPAPVAARDIAGDARVAAERDMSPEAGSGGSAGEGRSSRLSRRLETLGKLTDSVAHDFNNLLAIILGNLEQLQDRARDPELQHQVKTAHDAAKRGERLVRSLLSFARSQPIDRRVLDLNVVIHDMEPLLAHCLGLNVQLTMSLDPDLGRVETDASQTEMAILNLAVNARDAMPGGGALRIATTNVALSGEYDGLRGAFVALTIADTGCGMSPEILARAFEPFFTTKPADRGTGLGLSMVRDFAKRFHGTTAVQSELGKGTAVTIYLPRSPSVIGKARRGHRETRSRID